MKIKVLLFAAALPLNLFGQLTDFHGVLNELANSRQFSSLLHKNGAEIDPNEFTGNPYLHNFFLPAEISGKNGLFMMRYNIFNDEIILQNGEKEFYKLPKSPEFSLITFKNNDKISLINDNYYIIVSGDQQKGIIKKLGVKFSPAKPSVDGYQPDIKARFTDTKPEYFYTSNNGVTPLTKNLEELINLLPEKKDKIKKKKKKINRKTDLDYQNLYNEINLGQ